MPTTAPTETAQAPLSFDELSALIGDPTTVTLAGTNVPIKKTRRTLLDAAGVVGDEGNQGIPGIPEDPSLRPVSVNWQKLPFWEAAQQVEDLTGAHWTAGSLNSFNFMLYRPTNAATGVPGSFTMPSITGLSFGDLVNEGDLNGRVAFENPYLKVLAVSISSGRQASNALSTTEEEENAPTWDAHLKLAIYPDPKLKIDSLEVSDVKVVARGTVINAPEPQQGFDFVSSLMSSASDGKSLFSLKNISLPGLTTDTVLSTISGVMHLNIATGTDIWQVDDLLAKPTSMHTANGVNFRVEEAHIEDGALHLKLTVDSAQGVSNLNRLNDNLKIYDGDGQLLQQEADNQGMSFGGILPVQTNAENTADSNRDFSKELVFKSADQAPVAGPISIKWSLLSNIRTLTVPFELHDVKVP